MIGVEKYIIFKKKLLIQTVSVGEQLDKSEHEFNQSCKNSNKVRELTKLFVENNSVAIF